MQERTKMRPTDGRHVLVVACPEARFEAVMEFLEKNGCAVNDATYYGEECVCHEEVFPECSPGLHLRGLRYREDLTQAELGRRAGICARRISEMENGRRPIDREAACALAKVFDTDPRLFLEK